jgi:dolichyl-phosphate beta-glucosyltransferase
LLPRERPVAAAFAMSEPPQTEFPLSIVIPAFNEAARLPGSLQKIFAYLQTRRLNAEVLVVNDGSSDGTAAVAGNAHPPAHVRVRVLSNSRNRGKGYSIRRGMLAAAGARLLFTDADLSAPIEEFAKLEAALDAGADIAIGSRSRRELILVHQSPFREMAGRVFNLLVNGLLRLRLRDTQCGFKLFRQSAAQAIFPWQRIERWGFDPEILYVARKRGLRVAEVPVVWAHAEGTKIGFDWNSMHAFLEVAEIRWNWLQGRYSGAAPSTPTEPGAAPANDSGQQICRSR